MNSTPQQESKALVEFKPFSRLPLELQARIFKEAQPGPTVTDLYLHFHVDENHTTVIATLRRYHELNNLLLACRESHAEIFRRFQKFEVMTPPLFEDYVSNPSGYFRPHIDILLVNATMMLQLYDMGGRLSLENITQLALDDIILESWYCPRTILSVRMNYAARLYTFLSNHCPALSKLWFIIETGISGMGYPSSKHLIRMLDLSDGLVDLFLLVNMVYYRPEIKKIKDYVDMIAGDFNRFLNTKESDPWPASEEATLKYWETRVPVTALLCLITRHESVTDFHSCKVEHSGNLPWLWVPALNINIACHQDGTPVQKYKGLTQMFDGEPW